MTTRIIRTFIFALLVGTSATVSAAASASDVILLSNVDVIDATGGPIQTGMNVLIEDGLIAAVRQADGSLPA